VKGGGCHAVAHSRNCGVCRAGRAGADNGKVKMLLHRRWLNLEFNIGAYILI